MRRPIGFFLAAALSFAPLAGGAADNVDTTLVAARQAAHNDRNAESARLFQQVLAAAPERRLELLPELSDQLTYSGKPDQAIPLYREVLAHPLAADQRRHIELGLALALSWAHHLPASLKVYSALLASNPRDMDALLGHARVLSWEDQLTPSLREYQHILALDPGNLEAQQNIARVQSWRGRLHLAESDARAILAKHPGDLSASLTLADSKLWMGRPDLAAIDERPLLAAHPNDSGVLDLEGDLHDANAGQFNVATSYATSSDGLLIRSSTFESALSGLQGLGQLGVRYQPIAYISNDGVDSAMERRLGLYARAKLTDWAEINGTFSNDEISATDITNKTLLLYNTYVTLRPNDTFRFDIGSRADTFDNIISLRDGIVAVYQSFSMDITPDPDNRFTVRASQAALSDGNRQGWEQLEFDHAVLQLPHVSFGAQGTSYSFSQSPNNGYFDPPRYQSAELTGHIYGNSRRRLYYDGTGAFGHEWVVNGGNRPVYAVHGDLSYVISRPFNVSAFYDSFNTRQTNSGFGRTTIGVALQTKW